MVVPDSAMIAEIILFGEGFNNTKVGQDILYYTIHIFTNTCLYF